MNRLKGLSQTAAAKTATRIPGLVALGWVAVFSNSAIGQETATPTPLESVPMQGGMMHVEFEYHADHFGLHVHIPDALPLALALSESHPDNQFIEGDPWFHDLDPRHNGQAFNRQFGFVMSANSDLLPVGQSIRIRGVSMSPGLKAFKYRGSNPKEWSPLFQPENADSDLIWNLAMFHPAFVMPNVPGEYSAELEAQVIDDATGEPVAAVAALPFTLTLQVPGEPTEIPELSIGERMVLSWPMDGGQYIVEYADSPDAEVWTHLHVTPVDWNGEKVVLLEAAEGRRFFRLSKMTMMME